MSTHPTRRQFTAEQNIADHSTSKKRWSGYWYVNVNDVGNRSWADQRRIGFVTAGGGRQYSRPLDKLKVGDPVFAYLKSKGYVG